MQQYLYQNKWFVHASSPDRYTLHTQPSCTDMTLTPNQTITVHTPSGETLTLLTEQLTPVTIVIRTIEGIQLPCLLTYHVTTEAASRIISKEGIVPQTGPRAKLIGETEALIYLFPNKDSMENAILNWFGDLYETQEDENDTTADCTLHAFCVYIPILFDPPLPCTSDVGYEIRYPTPIPPSWVNWYAAY